MEDSSLLTVLLPIALGIIMFGLGLGLTVADFRRVARYPRAVLVALVCQLLLLPAVCFGLVLLFDLPPALAVGMMLLAASPGGTTANLYSQRCFYRWYSELALPHADRTRVPPPRLPRLNARLPVRTSKP